MLGVDVPGHHQIQLTQTLIVRLLKALFLILIPDCEKSTVENWVIDQTWAQPGYQPLQKTDFWMQKMSQRTQPLDQRQGLKALLNLFVVWPVWPGKIQYSICQVVQWNWEIEHLFGESDHVWSLVQFYFVSFSISRIIVFKQLNFWNNWSVKTMLAIRGHPTVPRVL